MTKQENEARRTGHHMARSTYSVRRVRETSAVILGLATLLGVVMTALGVSYSIISFGSSNRAPSLPSQIIGGILVSFGSAIVGAAVSTFVTRQTGQDLLEDIRTMISDSLGSRFTSAEESLTPLRYDWFHYHITGANHQNLWRHDVYKFLHSASVSSLVTNMTVRDGATGINHQYKLEGGVRGTRFVIIQTRIDGGELPIIQIYPSMAESFRTVHCGLMVLQDWDGRNVITKTILSRKQLIPGLKEGDVPSRDATNLDKVWRNGAENAYTIFPDSGASS
jgi:hypothetical protein